MPPRKGAKKAPARRTVTATKRPTRAVPAKKRAGGRPSVLTRELSRQIAASVLEGNFIETAAAIHGIHKDTLFEWLKRGARAERAGALMQPDDRIYCEFSDAVKRAWADSEAAALRKVRAAEDWRAQAWYLERTRRDRFQQKVTVATTEAVESPTVDLSRLSIEELEQWEALAAKAAVPREIPADTEVP